jgi:hypothetical protein
LNPEKVQFGWPSLDKFGSLRPGDVVSFTGRPALGKTFSMLQIAIHSAFKQTLPNLFVPMGMPLMDHIQNYALTSAQRKKLPHLLMKAKNEAGRLWVLDGNFASTVQDIFPLVYQFNPRALFIDGAYLLQHPDRRLDRYKRAGATRWQRSRRSPRARKGYLEDVAYGASEAPCDGRQPDQRSQIAGV